MELLELPLEAVALRLYTLPAAGATAWTFLAAVLAAAVAAAAGGFWRFRASSTLAVAITSQPPPSSPPPPPPPPVASPSPKVRYTAYFSDAGRVGCCHVDDDRDDGSLEEEVEAEEEDDGVSEALTAPLVRWEVVGVRRRPDLGWYSCLDLTAFDGSIVRLWDGPDGVRTASSPRRRGSLGITAF